MDLNWKNFWYESKGWLADEFGVVRDQLHVHFGLFVFLFIAMLLRNRRYGALMAWIVVASLQAINEALDARDWMNWTGSVNWGEIASDTIATLFWPTVLLVLWQSLGPRRSHPEVETTRSKSSHQGL
ncbi:hypothetical protein ACOXXX_19940 [Thalassococcus sp. BH17M4-6]|uniref:hypothetical protein n=1 Tax=Thalassococcus sp. BH17M4-6 TaxID=3413148 RepID=UPI003BD0B8AD